MQRLNEEQVSERNQQEHEGISAHFAGVANVPWVNDAEEGRENPSSRESKAPEEECNRSDREDAGQVTWNASHILAKSQSARLRHCSPRIQHEAGEDAMELVLRFVEKPKRFLPADRSKLDRAVIIAPPLAMNGAAHGIDLVVPKALAKSLEPEHRANNHRHDGQRQEPFRHRRPRKVE